MANETPAHESPKEPHGKPLAAFEAAYKEHLRKVKAYWATFDIDAIDITALPENGESEGNFLCVCVPWFVFPTKKQ